MSLVLKKVSKTFGHTTALKDVTLSFECGDVTAIVGDNGAGKSTLCKIISGAYKPSSGTLSLDGVDIQVRTTHQVRELGIEMVYQDLALFRQQDVVTNLFLGREKTKGVLCLLDRKGMYSLAEKLLLEIGVAIPSLNVPITELSGGQRQAVAIARTLLFTPRVLLLDEPTAALAVGEIGQVLKLIRKLKERGIIVILVSHRLNDVFEVSDRILTLRAGSVVADSPTNSTSIEYVVSTIVGANIR